MRKKKFHLRGCASIAQFLHTAAADAWSGASFLACHCVRSGAARPRGNGAHNDSLPCLAQVRVHRARSLSSAQAISLENFEGCSFADTLFRRNRFLIPRRPLVEADLPQPSAAGNALQLKQNEKNPTQILECA